MDAYGLWQIIKFQKPIFMNGKKGRVKVNPGDIIFADSDSVISIEKKIAKKVFDLALKRLKKEDLIRKEIKKFSPDTKNIHKMYKKIGRW